MPINDWSTDGTQHRISRFADKSADGTLHAVRQINDWAVGGVQHVVYQSTKYLVKNGVAQVAWSMGGVEGVGATGYVQTPFGFSSVSYGGTDNTGVASLATDSPIDFSGFSTITFVFTRWARDASPSGYYRTSAGIYSNRIVGRGGSSATAEHPSSVLQGWICSGLPGGGGTFSFAIAAGVTSGYVGIATGGGAYGNGAVSVSDIYLSA